ncbi:MAG: hypothetical protein KC419_09775 [Anaerolineales bacterium]|nr:hypothetical protein [Anaerolineales bacterium]MCA9928756.1 hypothetical protein [Anaerolineales bacterium]
MNLKKSVLLILLLFLIACGPVAVSETAETAVPADDPAAVLDEEAEAVDIDADEPAPISTEAADAAAEEPAATETTGESDDEDGETAVADTDAQTTANADFSAAATADAAGELRSHDWIKGAEDARITIIEYGDFQ